MLVFHRKKYTRAIRMMRPEPFPSMEPTGGIRALPSCVVSGHRVKGVLSADSPLTTTPYGTENERDHPAFGDKKQ